MKKIDNGFFDPQNQWRAVQDSINADIKRTIWRRALIVTVLVLAGSLLVAYKVKAQAIGIGGPPINESVIVWPRQGNTQFITRQGRPNQTIWYQDGSSGYGYGGYGCCPSQDLMNYSYGLQAFAPLFQGQPSGYAPAPVMPYMDSGVAAKIQQMQQQGLIHFNEVDTSNIEGY